MIDKIDDKAVQRSYISYELNPKEAAAEVSQFKEYVPEVVKWLPLAAKEYAISPHIRDYVVVPVIMFPTDLPNRNSVAFPYEDLMKYDIASGCPAYKTWRGKPTFTEHEHHDPLQAKGIIFDVYMKPIKNTIGNIHKVIALCGFDRTKDPVLANAIATKKRTRYSMGATVGTYECSVCGAKSPKNRRETECGHVVRGQFRTYETASGTKPAYYLAHDIAGFEISSVGVPAWAAAEESDVIFNL